MVLEGVVGVVFKRSDERKKRKYFEKGARKDSMGRGLGEGVSRQRRRGEGASGGAGDRG